jgi:small redox-active disulfide protein 2
MAKRIEVYALGCAKCKRMEMAVNTAVQELGLDIPVERLLDPVELQRRGAYSQPALFIDGKLVAAGVVPSVDDLKALLTGKEKAGESA